MRTSRGRSGQETVQFGNVLSLRVKRKNGGTREVGKVGDARGDIK